VSTAGNTGRNVYRIAVFPREVRVRALAYMRAARNVGYTLGALAGGIALAIGTHAAIIAVPLLTGALLLLNAAMVAALPSIERQAPPSAHGDEVSAPAPPAWRNGGFVVLSACNGVLTSNQVLLNVVVPLWLVERTGRAHVLLAWLFGTNTVMAVLLQVRASRGSETVPGALRAVRLCGWSFVLSCLVISLTHETVGWLSIVLIWLGHVTITGAELWQSASDWGFQAELSDHRRLGDYQGVWSLGYQVGPILFPASTRSSRSPGRARVGPDRPAGGHRGGRRPPGGARRRALPGAGRSVARRSESEPRDLLTAGAACSTRAPRRLAADQGGARQRDHAARRHTPGRRGLVQRQSGCDRSSTGRRTSRSCTTRSRRPGR
jgi:hypothetical protein